MKCSKHFARPPLVPVNILPCLNCSFNFHRRKRSIRRRWRIRSRLQRVWWSVSRKSRPYRRARSSVQRRSQHARPTSRSVACAMCFKRLYFVTLSVSISLCFSYVTPQHAPYSLTMSTTSAADGRGEQGQRGAAQQAHGGRGLQGGYAGQQHQELGAQGPHGRKGNNSTRREGAFMCPAIICDGICTSGRRKRSFGCCL